MIGLTLFSTFLNLVQKRLELLSEVVTKRIHQDYKDRLQAEAIPRDKSAQVEALEQMIKEDGGMLRFLLDKQRKDQLQGVHEAVANRVSRACQTETNIVERACQTEAKNVEDKGAQAYRFVRMARRYPQNRKV